MDCLGWDKNGVQILFFIRRSFSAFWYCTSLVMLHTSNLTMLPDIFFFENRKKCHFTKSFYDPIIFYNNNMLVWLVTLFGSLVFCLSLWVKNFVYDYFVLTDKILLMGRECSMNILGIRTCDSLAASYLWMWLFELSCVELSNI